MSILDVIKVKHWKKKKNKGSQMVHTKGKRFNIAKAIFKIKKMFYFLIMSRAYVGFSNLEHKQNLKRKQSIFNIQFESNLKWSLKYHSVKIEMFNRSLPNISINLICEKLTFS